MGMGKNSDMVGKIPPWKWDFAPDLLWISLRKIFFSFLSVFFCVNIVLLSVEREEGELGNVVLTFTILAKTISNIGWFIMWVQQIEVKNKKEN
jgi:hypothetical protein